MSKSDTRYTVLECVNTVQRLLGVDPTTTLSANKHTQALLQFLNQTQDEISDFDDWQEEYAEVVVSAVSGQASYGLGVTYPLKSIYEISFNSRPQSLYVLTIEDINRLSRAGGFGEPRQFCLKGVDNQGNPKFTVHPRPGGQQNGQTFTIALYKKPRNFDTSDGDNEIEFPGNLVILGTYHRALVEENGGNKTDQSERVLAEYTKGLKESINRFNSDTGVDVNLYPAMR